ncbi:exonuclease domain-containing protein [Pradoshia sp.]
MENKYVVVDLETTGNNSKAGDRIIQFAAIVIEYGEITYQYSSYVNPERPIPPFIQEFTGITEEDVKSAPTFKEIAPYIIGILEEAVFVAHNVLFDLTFLQAELERVGYEMFLGYTVDTVEMAKVISPRMDSFKLEDLSKAYGHIHDCPHQADSDAYATALLFLDFYKSLKRLPRQTLKSLYRLSYSLKSELKEVFAEVLREQAQVSEPWRPDLEIYRGIALTLPRKATEASVIPRAKSEPYTYIQEMFRAGGTGFLEDGTYAFFDHLLACHDYAKTEGKQVLLSTYRELAGEALAAHMPGLSVEELKQDSNYLSLPKFEQSLRQRDHNYEVAMAKMQMLVWLTETVTGDLNELNLSSAGKEYAKEVAHHHHLHPRLLKPWTERDFYGRRLNAAKRASVILTTHDAYVNNMVCSGYLSEVPYVLVEEADSFPTVLKEELSYEISYMDMRNIVNKVGNLDNNQLIHQAVLLVGEKTGVQLNYRQLEGLVLQLSNQIDRFAERLIAYGEKKAAVAESQLAAVKLPRRRKKSLPIYEAAADLRETILSLMGLFQGWAKELNGVPVEKLKRSQLNMMDEWMKMHEQLAKVYNGLGQIFVKPTGKNDTWIEWNQRGNRNSLSIKSKPAAIAEWMKVNMVSKKNIIFTSEVLAIRDSFRYFASKVGCEEPRNKTLIVAPNASARLVIIRDACVEKEAQPEAFFDCAKGFLADLIERREENMIFFFNTPSSLKRMYLDLKLTIETAGYQALVQGFTSGSAGKLLRGHMGAGKSILFMTYPVWETIRHLYDGHSLNIMVEAPTVSRQLYISEIRHKELPEGNETLLDMSFNIRRLLTAKFPVQNESGWILFEDHLLAANRAFFAELLSCLSVTTLDKEAYM